MKYYVYILECADKSFYTGITWNLEKRLKEHKSKIGARFTKNKTPIELVYWELFNNKFKAAKREKEIKGWRREKKINLINSFDKNRCV